MEYPYVDLGTLKEDIADGLFDDQLNEYMDLKAIGRDSFAALCVVFGAGQATNGMTSVVIAIIEGSQKYIEGMPAAMDRMKHVKIWDAQIAARNLYAIATTAPKASERLAAAKELNVIYGVTIIDENGKTKAGGMTLKDFWALKAESDASNTQKPH